MKKSSDRIYPFAVNKAKDDFLLPFVTCCPEKAETGKLRGEMLYTGSEFFTCVTLARTTFWGQWVISMDNGGH